MTTFAKLKDCDLIIEAVVENLEIKRKLFERVEQHRRAGSIVASNTSGIPIHLLAEGRSEDFRQHFLGIHFFNPPRYLHLVEIIRTEWTKPEVSCFIYGFLDQRLGKGVVAAKDRPNFIANRIGTFGALHTDKTMLEDGYSIEEIDKITGPAVGRPKSATFRTFDIVGLDVFAHVVKNLYEALPEDEEREMFVAPEVLATWSSGAFSATKPKAASTKNKRAQAKGEIWVIDPATLEYRPSEKVKLPSLDWRRTSKRSRAHQGAGLGQRSRGHIFVEDFVAHSELLRQPNSRDCGHRGRGRSSLTLGLWLGVGSV